MNNNYDGRDFKFDYIVVGTGPSGAVVAKTLSDDRNTSVLVLEAGENNDMDWPIMDSTFPVFNMFPKYFWQGRTFPQKHVNNKSFDWTTGRLSGGGSSVNNQQYVRPTFRYLEKWEQFAGPLWSPDKAILSFIELENFNGITDNPGVHGYKGPIDIRQAPRNVPRSTKKFVTAIEQATGYEEILDYNNPNTPIGPFERWQLSQKPNGLRESSSTALLNLTVMTPEGIGVNGRKLRVLYKSTALKIIFKNKTAVGVEFLREGICQRAFASKKVIICAGINSAQLLLLSGIGPEEELKKNNIPLVFDNPSLGNNLTNHTFNTATMTMNPSDANELLQDPYSLFSGEAFLPIPLPDANKNTRGVRLIGRYSNGNFNILIQDLQTFSRGFIMLQNNDPLKVAHVNEQILSSPIDLEVIKSIYQIYIKYIAKKLNLIDSTYQLISPREDVLNNDSLLEEFIRSNMTHSYHQQGSLRMAPLENCGVVNSQGEVYGVKNLIVADASILPFVSDGPTTAFAYLVGYTIAKKLKGQ